MDPSDDLIQLQQTAQDWATQRLEQDGQVAPFGLAMLLNGEVALVADGDGLDADEATSTYLRGLHAKRDELRAIAICADVRVKASRGDALRLTLEHRGDLALELLMPYVLVNGIVEFGTTQMGRGPRFIWEVPEEL
jgi:hypothetical protein